MRFANRYSTQRVFLFDDIGLIAVTDSPGLAGALLVGISFALGIHCGRGVPVTGINHLEGHICSIFLEHPDIGLPFLALIVSGGHTSIYKVNDFGDYECLGQTVDDAAGEAFDKVGKLLGFNYPAGRAIEREAALTPSADPYSLSDGPDVDGDAGFQLFGAQNLRQIFFAGTRAGIPCGK